MKVLVLGGTGFVGRNVCQALASAQIDCTIASRSTGTDLRVPEEAARLFAAERPDFVINCAAHVGSLNYVTEQAATVIADNSRMCLSMYEAIAEHAPRAIVINPIANCAYPASEETFIEDRWWNGHLHRSVLAYGATRRLLWAAGECFGMQHGIRSISLLVPNMYGPHDSTDPNKAHALNALIAKFVRAKRRGEREVSIWGTGIAIREWLHAADFGRVIEELIRTPTRIGLDEPVNVGQNFGLSVRELVTLIQGSTGFGGDVRYDSSKPDGAPRKVMDDRRFRKVFPEFRFTDFRKGVLQTVEYYESIYPY